MKMQRESVTKIYFLTIFPARQSFSNIICILILVSHVQASVLASIAKIIFLSANHAPSTTYFVKNISSFFDVSFSCPQANSWNYKAFVYCFVLWLLFLRISHHPSSCRSLASFCKETLLLRY